MNPTVQEIHNLADSIHEQNMEHADFYCENDDCAWYGIDSECSHDSKCPWCNSNVVKFTKSHLNPYRGFMEMQRMFLEAMITLVPKNDRFFATTSFYCGEMAKIEYRIIDTSIPRYVEVNGVLMENPTSNVVFGDYSGIWFSEYTKQYVVEIREAADSLKKIALKMENLYPVEKAA